MTGTIKHVIKNIQKNSIPGLLLLFLVYSCDDNQFISITNEVPLINLQDPYRTLPAYKFTVSTNTLKLIYEKNGVQNPDSFIKYPVSFHRLVYTTTYKGEQISASGAIVIPICPQIAPGIVSFQHGTMFADSDAPSNAVSDELPFFNEYILFIPDYIGYGVSKDIVHPYYIYQTSATAVIDFIKAGKKYLDDNHVLYNPDKLFLSGHSEGGYVTVAVQKELETNPVDGLKVTASAPSAGPYDVELVGKLIFQNNTYPSPAYLLLILTSYNDYYNWQRHVTDFFQKPYSFFAMSLLNGNLNEDEINQELTTNLTLLIDSTFLNNYRDDGETEFKQMLLLNSVYNWATKTPTRLYHGTSDNLVPFEVSQKTYESFISNGSDTAVVKLVPLPGIGHDYIPAYKQILEWFKTFR
jgi:pimeloyl-ACP methyl ester carboxylesterase